MFFDGANNLFFAVTLLHVETSSMGRLMEISSMSWFYFWGIGHRLNVSVSAPLAMMSERKPNVSVYNNQAAAWTGLLPARVENSARKCKYLRLYGRHLLNKILNR